MIGPHYSRVGHIVSTFIPCHELQPFLDGLAACLLTAGWKILARIPGPGFSNGYQMESAAVPVSGLIMRVKFFYTGANAPFGGPIVEFVFSDQNETHSSDYNGTYGAISIDDAVKRRPEDGVLTHKKIRIICGPHQCFMKCNDWTLFAGNGITQYSNLGFGIPSFVDDNYRQPSWWAVWDGFFISSFFDSFHPTDLRGSAFYIDSILRSGSSDNAGTINPQLLTFRESELGNPTRILSDMGLAYPVILPKLVTGLSGRNYVTAVPLWDSFISCGVYNKFVTTYVDGRSWENYTINNATGSLFLATGGSPIPQGLGGYSY